MKNVLVVYYTQSGQLTQIIDNFMVPFKANSDFQVNYEQIIPINEYPFPWGEKFFDVFPESVKGIPCDLKPFSSQPDISYDLVILAYQTWYLSPSIPFNSFLQTEYAGQLLKGKKVITLLGVRNMWICSQEIVKRRLQELGAIHAGNIVLQDRSDNLVAAITIIRWLTKGKKEPTFLFPEAGVSKKDITATKTFGEIVMNAALTESYSNLQDNLVRNEAVRVKYHLAKMEFNARKIFNKLAGFTLKKGKAGDPRRKGRIQLCKWYIIFALFIISPFASLIFMTLRILLFPFANKKISYYRGVDLIAK